MTKMDKVCAFFVNLAWKGSIVGFFLIVALFAVVLFHPEAKVAGYLIPSFALLIFYFMGNLSISYAIQIWIDLIDVRNKKIKKRMGLEQAFVDFAIFLFCWWVIYWVVKKMIFT